MLPVRPTRFPCALFLMTAGFCCAASFAAKGQAPAGPMTQTAAPPPATASTTATTKAQPAPDVPRKKNLAGSWKLNRDESTSPRDRNGSGRGGAAAADAREADILAQAVAVMAAELMLPSSWQLTGGKGNPFRLWTGCAPMRAWRHKTGWPVSPCSDSHAFSARLRGCPSGRFARRLATASKDKTRCSTNSHAIRKTRESLTVKQALDSCGFRSNDQDSRPLSGFAKFDNTSTLF